MSTAARSKARAAVLGTERPDPHSVCLALLAWTIGLDDGCAREPDSGCTPRFSVRVQGPRVQLDADELATHALDEPPPVAPGNRIAVACK